MKMHTIVVSKNEMGMSGPALRAMTGNANTTLIDGAMWVMPWNTTCGRPSTLRWRRAAVVGAAACAVIWRTSCGYVAQPVSAIMNCLTHPSRGNAGNVAVTVSATVYSWAGGAE